MVLDEAHIILLEEVSNQVGKVSVFRGTEHGWEKGLPAEARKMTSFQRSVLGNFHSHINNSTILTIVLFYEVDSATHQVYS